MMFGRWSSLTVHRRFSGSVIPIVILSISFQWSSRLDARQDSQRKPVERHTLSRVECGIYALAAAAMSLEIEFDLSSLVRGDYVIPAKGSSMAQLSQAARDCGFWAYPFRNIGAEFLESTERPLLLNLGSPRSSKCPGHWVTFLGERDGKALVYDLARTPRVSLWSYGDLLQKMSGDALMLSATEFGPGDFLEQKLTSLSRYWPLLPLVVTGLMLRRCVRMSVYIETFALLILAIFWAFLMGAETSGFGSNRGAVAWIQAKFMPGYRTEAVSFDQLKALAERHDVAIVDARTRWQFEIDHIPGAICLGVDLESEDFADEAGKIRDRRMVVVYCGNPQCGWARLIAARLTSIGLKDARVFEGGLELWNEQLPGRKQ